MTTGLRLSWQIEASEIPEQTEALIAKTRAVYDSVGSVGADRTTYANVIKVNNT
jgi:hypothetical protein